MKNSGKIVFGRLNVKIDTMWVVLFKDFMRAFIKGHFPMVFHKIIH